MGNDVRPQGNKWSDWNNPGGDGSENGKSKRLPLAIIRKLQAQSTAGGTAECHFCGQMFSANYIRNYEISWRVTEFVCKDCAKEKGLQIRK
jgi:hypothetical protein